MTVSCWPSGPQRKTINWVRKQKEKWGVQQHGYFSEREFLQQNNRIDDPNDMKTKENKQKCGKKCLINPHPISSPRENYLGISSSQNWPTPSSSEAIPEPVPSSTTTGERLTSRELLPHRWGYERSHSHISLDPLRVSNMQTGEELNKNQSVTKFNLDRSPLQMDTTCIHVPLHMEW